MEINPNSLSWKNYCDIIQEEKRTLSIDYSLSVFRNKRGKDKIKEIRILEIFDLDKQKKVRASEKIQEKLRREILERERQEIRETEKFLKKVARDLKKIHSRR
jgi:hypothetical protein